MPLYFNFDKFTANHSRLGHNYYSNWKVGILFYV